MLMLFYTGGDDDGVAAATISCFQVILFNHPMHWQKEDGRIDLRVFSSDTGRWEAKQLDSQFAGGEAIFGPPAFLQNGLVLWTPYADVENRAVAFDYQYDADDDNTVVIVSLMPVPAHATGSSWNRVFGDVKDGTRTPTRRRLRCGTGINKMTNMAVGCWHTASASPSCYGGIQRQTPSWTVERRSSSRRSASIRLTRTSSSWRWPVPWPPTPLRAAP
jgi:hypothetical protein